MPIVTILTIVFSTIIAYNIINVFYIVIVININPTGGLMEDQKEKSVQKETHSYTLEVPTNIWMQARQNSITQRISLGQYYLDAIAEKNEREAQKKS
jgi:hypothetical protein